MNEEEEFLPGGFDELLRQAQEMQEELAFVQDEAATTIVEGQSGGGAVRITVNGAMEFQSVRIAPDAVDPDDVALLEDLILAALHDAVAKAADLVPGGSGGAAGLFGGTTIFGEPGFAQGGLGAVLGGLLGGGDDAGAGFGALQDMLGNLMGLGSSDTEDEEVGGFLSAGDSDADTDDAEPEALGPEDPD